MGSNPLGINAKIPGNLFEGFAPFYWICNLVQHTPCNDTLFLNLLWNPTLSIANEEFWAGGYSNKSVFGKHPQFRFILYIILLQTTQKICADFSSNWPLSSWLLWVSRFLLFTPLVLLQKNQRHAPFHRFFVPQKSFFVHFRKSEPFRWFNRISCWHNKCPLGEWQKISIMLPICIPTCVYNFCLCKRDLDVILTFFFWWKRKHLKWENNKRRELNHY